MTEIRDGMTSAVTSSSPTWTRPSSEDVVRKPPPAKFGAIDVGSNSVHLVMVEISPEGDFEVLGRDRDPVRLGQGGFEDHLLTQEAMDRGVDTLKRFRKMCELKGVTRLQAVATSAVREAHNGGDFVERVRREVDLRLRVISREEEGRLIYVGVRHAVNLGDRDHLIVDVGGGSTELVVGNATEPRAIHSFKLGGARLAELFLTSDPPTDGERKKLRNHIRETFEPALAQFRGYAFKRCIGTSGSIKSLALLARHLLAEESDCDPDEWTHLTLTRSDIKLIINELGPLSREDRRKCPGLDARRVDSTIPVAHVMLHLMMDLDIDGIDFCDFALREGVIIDHISRHRQKLLARATWPDPRRRSAIHLAERCGYRREHAEQVTRLALRLFDQLGRVHQLEPSYRELLAHACLLHDIGYLISHKDHHRHSYYLISNGDLKGFDEQEVEVIANIARYHRKNRPKKTHANFSRLATAHRGPVQAMAVLLRLANALDRTHYSVVDDVTCRLEHRHIGLEVHTTQDAELELWMARRHAKLFRREFAAGFDVELAQPDGGSA
jgi:exopolyphosphatase/guanosine-5'-triphosphate,3'-diphosphate pyrophosphatase